MDTSTATISNNLYTTTMETINIPNNYITTGTITLEGTYTGTAANWTAATTSSGTGSSYTINNPASHTLHDSAQIKKVEELAPNKVYRFTFYDDTKVKTICAEGDTFNLEYAFFLAIAKKLYGKALTFEGVLKKAEEMSCEKYYIKIVKKAKKEFLDELEAKDKEEIEKQLEKERREHRRAKNKNKKEKRKLKEQEFLIEAIRKALEREV